MLTTLIQPTSKISEGLWGGWGGGVVLWEWWCSWPVLDLVRCFHFRYITIFCFLRSMCSLVCKFNYMGHKSQLHEGK